MTAITKAAPVIMKRSEDDRFSSANPLAIDWMTMMPSTAENGLPRAPNWLVPRSTAAVIAFRFTSPVLACRGGSCRGKYAVTRSIRPISLGRKNLLFAGSDAMMVIETAKLSGFNPENHFAEVLACIRHYDQACLDDLLPWK